MIYFSESPEKPVLPKKRKNRAKKNKAKKAKTESQNENSNNNTSVLNERATNLKTENKVDYFQCVYGLLHMCLLSFHS